MSLTLIVPGAIDQLTGGYLFARHVVDESAAAGAPLDVVELAGEFPDADAVAATSAAAALAALPDGAAVVIDGLALPGFETCLAREARRLPIVVWVHHLLSEETGLSSGRQARLADLEARLLPLARGVLCPSRFTAASVAACGLARGRIAVVPPGTHKPAPRAPRRLCAGTLRLLSVGTITPRKGHLLLVKALARLASEDWSLRIVGSPARDPLCANDVQRAIADAALEDRIALAGEIAPSQLGDAYAASDLFVLPSFHEGYGMVYAEALAHGVPIVAARAGAVPEIVPPSAGILVPPGDDAALATALAGLLSDRAALARLAEGAAEAGTRLPDWPDSAARWRQEVARLVR